MFLKTLAKLVKLTVEKKICFCLVEKPTKVVEKNQCLGLSSPVATSEN
jgi:hypothetical protein